MTFEACSKTVDIILEIYIFYGKGKETHELGTSFFLCVSVVKRIELVSDRMPYTILRIL
jgi:hypothetical protein